MGESRYFAPRVTLASRRALPLTGTAVRGTFRCLMSYGPYRRSTALLKAAARYARLRSVVYQDVVTRIAPSLPAPLRLTGFLPIVDKTWSETWAPYRGQHEEGGWDWTKLTAMYRNKPDSLHVAIWSGDTLCGLAAGQPSKQHTRLRLEWIEGFPGPTHPLKGHVLDIAVLAAEAYAVALEARTLRLINPAPGLVETYQEDYGFGPVEYDAGGTYCDMRIEP